VEKIYNKSISEIEKELSTDKNNGLSQEEAAKRLAENGENIIAEKPHSSVLVKFLNQFKDFMILILIIAAIVSGILNHINGEGMADTFIILIVIVVNAIIGTVQEVKSEKSMDALKSMTANMAKVIRNGKQIVIASKDLVVGDVVVIETGDSVAADMRVIESINLKTQESSLTGESVPVEKIANTLEQQDLPIGDIKKYGVFFIASYLW